MNERTVPDEFDTILRDAFTDVAGATRPDPGLADLLIANAREGRPAVTSLTTRREAKRWALPLLAVASVAAVVVGVVLAAKNVSDDSHSRPAHRPSQLPNPKVTKPSPPAVPDFHAADVSFVDAQHGWALGDAKCASGKKTSCPALLATTDGGSSWHPVGVPKHLVSTFDSASCGTNGTVAGPCVDEVLFANPDDGYLWSLHKLYWTTDGGRSWSRYIDPAHAWTGATKLVVSGNSVVRIAPIAQCSAGCAGAVEIAPVGTTKWEVVHPSSREVGLYSSNLSVTGSHLYLFAGGTAANTGAGVLDSDDGGRTWHTLATNVCGPAKDPEQDPFEGDASRVADDGALVVTCLGTRSGIRVARPGSGSFSGLRRLPQGDIVVLEAAQSEDRIVVANTTRAYTGRNIEATFYATTDGGRHWERTATVPVRGDSIRFTSGSTGYAIAADGSQLTATDDGGRTWRRVQFGS